jgi:hypothetical protein
MVDLQRPMGGSWNTVWDGIQDNPQKSDTNALINSVAAKTFSSAGIR